MATRCYVKNKRVVEATEGRPAFTRFAVYIKNCDGEELKIGAGAVVGINVSDEICISQYLTAQAEKFFGKRE